MHKYTNTQLNKCIDIDMLNKEHTNTCPLYVSVYTQTQHESMLVCTCLYKYVPKQISIFKHKCIHVYIYTYLTYAHVKITIPNRNIMTWLT